VTLCTANWCCSADERHISVVVLILRFNITASNYITKTINWAYVGRWRRRRMITDELPRPRIGLCYCNCTHPPVVSTKQTGYNIHTCHQYAIQEYFICSWAYWGTNDAHVYGQTVKLQKLKRKWRLKCNSGVVYFNISLWHLSIKHNKYNFTQRWNDNSLY